MPIVIRQSRWVWLSIGLIAAATLLPGSGAGRASLVLPDPADLLLNIALFVPFGMAVGRVAMAGHERPGYSRPLRVAAPTAMLLSTVIELLQLTIIPGRDASPWDIAANTLGGGLGAALPAVWLLAPLPLAWLASGWLLAPTPPPTPQWWGQWSHQFGSPVPFSGAIQSMRFNGIEAPGGPLGEAVTDQMRFRYRHGPITLSARLQPPSTPSPDRLHVAGIASGDGGEVIGLWQLGHDLELRWHARGTHWGLRHPSIRAPNLLEGLPLPEATISAFLEPGHAFIEITSHHRRGILLAPWQGWRLFWPLHPPRPLTSWLLAVAWSAGCVAVPMAFAMGSAIRGRSRDPLQ